MQKHSWSRVALAVATTRWGWSPENFWNSTPYEVRQIMKGIDELQGLTDPAALNETTVNELRDMIRNHQDKKKG